MSNLNLASTINSGVVVDLAHILRKTTSHYPSHSGFGLTLNRKHGDRTRADESSSASCTITMGSHTGTHLDAVGHVSRRGLLWDGSDAVAASKLDGLATGGIEETLPIVRPGVMLDVAALYEIDNLPAKHVVTASDLEAAEHRQNIEVEPGDVLLIRTGWDTFWEKDAYLTNETPGPGTDAAKWIVDHEISFAGSDTATFEHAPVAEAAPVHNELLFRHQIQLFENLHLQPLKKFAEQRFIFIATPLRIQGGTASPVRPIAIVQP